jgi:phosphate starvation-inducible PhoH-like protein
VSTLTTETANHPLETRRDYADNRMLAALCGAFDSNLAAIENAFGVTITRHGNAIAVHGEASDRDAAAAALDRIASRVEQGRALEPADVDAADPDAARRAGGRAGAAGAAR